MFWRIFFPYSLLIFGTAGVLGTLLVPAHWTEVWGVALLTAVVSWLPGLAIGRRLVRPLRELNAGARRIAAGNFGHKVYPIGTGEVGELARSFNEMSAHLAAQIAQLESD